MNIAEALYGEPGQIADALSGDNPTDDTSLLRAALANALNRIEILQRKVDRLEESGE